jgi:hypothetical protein
MKVDSSSYGGDAISVRQVVALVGGVLQTWGL